MHSFWMLFASFMFAIMGVCVKLAAETYSTAEIVMYRGLVGVVALLCLIRLRGGSLQTVFVGAHLWRGLVGVISLWMWFHAIAALPLATAMTLNYMAPIWIALIVFLAAWRASGQRVEWPLAGAIGLSFAGVTLLLQPVFHANQLAPALIALGSSVMSALAYMQVRKLGLMGEPEYRVVFYFSLVNVLAGLLGTGVNTAAGQIGWHPHDSLYGVGLLAAIGACATMAQMAMTRAYRLGNTLVVANLQYTGIVFSSAWGVLIFGDRLDWHSGLGMALILVSGSAATFYNTRNAKNGAKTIQTDPITSEI